MENINKCPKCGKPANGKSQLCLECLVEMEIKEYEMQIEE